MTTPNASEPLEPAISIRQARPEEAAELVALQRSAILRRCTGWCSRAQLRAWVAAITVEQHVAAAADGRVRRVALEDDAICGFASSSAGSGEIHALYVAPFAMGRGIGAALLADAEQVLLASGQISAGLDATANAVDFFRWHGYDGDALTSRHLGSGVRLSMTRMARRLR